MIGLRTWGKIKTFFFLYYIYVKYRMSEKTRNYNKKIYLNNYILDFLFIQIQPIVGKNGKMNKLKFIQHQMNGMKYVHIFLMQKS